MKEEMCKTALGDADGDGDTDSHSVNACPP